MIITLSVLCLILAIACVVLAGKLLRSQHREGDAVNALRSAEHAVADARIKTEEARGDAEAQRGKAVRAEVRAREKAIRAASLASWVFEIHQRQLLVYIPGVGAALSMRPVHGNVVEVCTRVLCNRDAKLLKDGPSSGDRSLPIQRCAFRVVHLVVPRMNNRDIYALLVDEDGVGAFAQEIDTLHARGELCPM